MIRLVCAAAAALCLSACAPDDSDPPANNAASAATPAANAAAPVAPLSQAKGAIREWLVGAWSLDQNCETDLIIHYNADGTLDNVGDVGTWSLEGDQVIETVSERIESGSEAPVKVDPPETRRYKVSRTDQGHGMLAYQGRNVPIQRC